MRADEFLRENDDDDHGYLPTPLKLGDYRDPYNPRDYGPYDAKFKDNQDLRDIVENLIDAGVEPAVVMISPRQLIATQDWLADARYRDSDPLFSDYEDRPVVLKYRGVDYILDGHHRCSSALRANQKLNVYMFTAPQGVAENFADGKGPGRPGDSVRHGIPKKATMAELEKASHASGRKGQLARWQLNMRRGHKK